MTDETAQRVQQELTAIGARGWVHAVDLDDPQRSWGLGADEPVVPASVFKVPVLVELCCQVEQGELQAGQRVRIGADERRTGGGIGTSVMLDDIELSLRDLAVLMMSISDNRATDVICDLVGLDRIAATLQRLELPGTVIPGDCQWLFDQIAADLGDTDWDDCEPGPDDPRLRLRAVRPAETMRTTPRETTALLRRIWTDDGIPPAAAAEIRRILALQVWPHRLATGFPDDRVTLAGKTGTLGPVRNEVGVVGLPTGERVAVAVFLFGPDGSSRNPDLDRAIGTVGRLAVDAALGRTG